MEVTAQVLRHLPKTNHPNRLVGTDTFDDAGVYQVREDLALVQTVDFFPPLVDDPYTFGQIAAANSLSDVYAMGGNPLTALNIVGFPDRTLPGEILTAILQGGAERIAAAGSVIVGGHSVRDEEVKYGLAVTGTIHPDKIIRNSTAKPGDKIVLTKPIGSGSLTSAAKSGRITEEELQEAITVMTTLNLSGSKAMCEVGVSAATDITGFGLVGHAYEVAESSHVTCELETSAIPLMDKAFELASEGIVTRTHKACIQHVGDKLVTNDVNPTLVNLLCDAQTSGGLLIFVPADRCDGLVSSLQAHNTLCWSVIGQVVEQKEYAIGLH